MVPPDAELVRCQKIIIMEDYEQYMRPMVPEMQKIYLRYNPSYIPSRERDYRALLAIAAFIKEQIGTPGQPHMLQTEILNGWKILAQAVSKNQFYRTKSLLTISNHIQEIAQIARDGEPKQFGKITGQELREGFDDYFK